MGGETPQKVASKISQWRLVIGEAGVDILHQYHDYQNKLQYIGNRQIRDGISLYTDGAVKNEIDKAGCVASQDVNLGGCNSAYVAELWGVLEGLKLV